MRYHTAVPKRSPEAGAVLVVLAAVLGCELVDPGPEVGVAHRCVLSSDFFLERIVPDYLERHGCAAEAGCHRAADAGSIFRLQDTSDVLAPLPGEPLSSWPAPWQENFMVTTAQISDCDVAELAPLYSEPAGGNTLEHGGGDLFPAGGEELDLIAEWLRGGG